MQYRPSKRSGKALKAFQPQSTFIVYNQQSLSETSHSLAFKLLQLFFRIAAHCGGWPNISMRESAGGAHMCVALACTMIVQEIGSNIAPTGDVDVCI